MFHLSQATWQSSSWSDLRKEQFKWRFLDATSHSSLILLGFRSHLGEACISFPCFCAPELSVFSLFWQRRVLWFLCRHISGLCRKLLGLELDRGQSLIWNRFTSKVFDYSLLSRVWPLFTVFVPKSASSICVQFCSYQASHHMAEARTVLARVVLIYFVH